MAEKEILILSDIIFLNKLRDMNLHFYIFHMLQVQHSSAAE
jgi:hypothetical protein